jgi:hypothetical protein
MELEIIMVGKISQSHMLFLTCKIWQREEGHESKREATWNVEE